MDYRKIRGENRNQQMQTQLNNRTQGGPAVAGQAAAQAGGNGWGARSLADKFATGIQSGFQPGNIGDINRAIWPFAFQFNSQNGVVNDIAPGQSATLSFSVTQEAGFLLRQISQSTFRKNLVTGEYEYIDPFYFDEAVNSPNGLKFSMEDASSTRFFNGRVSQELSLLGNANFPKIYPSTVFMLPNQTMSLNISNSGTDTFRPFVTVWGYRIRVEDAQKILSTVYSRGGSGQGSR